MKKVEIIYCNLCISCYENPQEMEEFCSRCNKLLESRAKWFIPCFNFCQAMVTNEENYPYCNKCIKKEEEGYGEIKSQFEIIISNLDFYIEKFGIDFIKKILLNNIKKLKKEIKK